MNLLRPKIRLVTACLGLLLAGAIVLGMRLSHMRIVSGAKTTNAMLSVPQVPPDPTSLVFDVNTGLINGVSPAMSNEAIRERFPFYSASYPIGSRYNYGGGVFYQRQDFYFYTAVRTLEIRAPFKISVKEDASNKDVEYFKALFGEPELRTLAPFASATQRIGRLGYLEKLEPEGATNYVFNTPYGHLELLVKPDGSGVVRFRAQHGTEMDPAGQAPPLGPEPGR